MENIEFGQWTKPGVKIKNKMQMVSKKLKLIFTQTKALTIVRFTPFLLFFWKSMQLGISFNLPRIKHLQQEANLILYKIEIKVFHS